MRGRPRLLSEDALLDAAAKALRRSGAKTTSEDIAREAGVSKGLLFCRYRTKGKLIAAVIDREARVAEDLLAKVDDPGQTPIGDSMVELGTQLLAILRRTVPFAELARSSRDSDELLRALACSRAAPQQLVQSCTSYFESQAARGHVAAVPPGILARIFFAPILERVLSENDPGNPASVGQNDIVFLRDLVQVILHGALDRGMTSALAAAQQPEERAVEVADADGDVGGVVAVLERGGPHFE